MPQPTPKVELPQAKPLETPKPQAKPVDLAPLLAKQGSAQTADQVAEATVFFYGFPGFVTSPMGRDRLNQIRKTTLEKGKTVITAADGKTEQANYQRFIVRGENQAKEKIRLEQDFPSAKYSLIFKDEKIYGIYNNTVFTPREDASRSFENQMFHGLEALLRYKENGSEIVLQPKEKLLGVEYYVLDVTDKQQRKTRFYISTKSFHVMMLTYDDAGVSYKRKFYDYNQAQGTLCPLPHRPLGRRQTSLRDRGRHRHLRPEGRRRYIRAGLITRFIDRKRVPKGTLFLVASYKTKRVHPGAPFALARCLRLILNRAAVF